jgi:putative oxidoreductase
MRAREETIMSAEMATNVDRAGGGSAARWLAPVGRVLYALIFILAAPGHFKAGTIGYAASAGVPLANVAVPVAGVIALLGGLSVALGFRARVGAWLLVVFLVPVTLFMHRFWGVADPMMAQMQQVNFMKNLALLGAALYLAWAGAGPVSLDARRPVARA